MAAPSAAACTDSTDVAAFGAVFFTAFFPATFAAGALFFGGADAFFAAFFAAANRFFTPALILASPSALIFLFFG